METGAYDPQWPYVHMQPTETVQAHQDLRGAGCCRSTTALSIWRCTPGMIRSSRWRWPRGIQVTTPMMGERIDIAAPHAGQRWWRQPHAAGAGQQPRMGDSRA